MNVTENKISEGHKVYHSLGIETSTSYMNGIVSAKVEGFTRGEPADEDPEIPSYGAAVATEYAYKWKSDVYPYLGIRYDHISRGTAPKYDYPGTPYSEQVETEHDILSARGGVHLTYDWMWVDIGTIIPFYTSTRSGNFGPDFGVGVKFGRLDVGYRFREYRMTDNHFTGDEELSFYFSGVQIGWTF
jgi:hypothetical protein